jgi:hypothetical protein
MSKVNRLFDSRMLEYNLIASFSNVRLGISECISLFCIGNENKNIPWALGAKKIKESALFRCQKNFPF